MTTAIEVDAGDFFRYVKDKPKTNFCDVWNRQFNENAYYRQIKSKIHLARLYKIITSKNLPRINEWDALKNYKYEDVWSV